MTGDLLNQAVSAIRSGDKAQGRKLLVQVLEQDSKNELAWLWLSRCVSSNDQKLDCLKRVLEINPENTKAKEEIARLQTLSNIKAQTQHPIPPKPTNPPARPAKQQKLSKLYNPLGFIIVTVIFLVCICVAAVMAISGEGGGGDNNYDSNRTLSYYACKNLIEKRLAAPSTVKWPSSSSIQIAKVKNTSKETYQVRGYFDAENYFGATIRTDYICEVSYQGNGDWHLEYLSLDE